MGLTSFFFPHLLYNCKSEMLPWTSLKYLNEEKQEQIDRYLSIELQDLIENAKVRTEYCLAYSLWLVILPTSKDSFQKIKSKHNDNKLLISTFDQATSGEYHLNFHSGNVKDSALSSILQKDMNFKRIPEGYISVPMENFKDPKFRDAIIQQLVTFLVIRKSKFSVTEICQGCFSIWEYFPAGKQKSIEKAAKKILKKLDEKTYFGKWLIYDHPYWELHEFSDTKLQKFINLVSKEDEIIDESHDCNSSII